MDDYFSKEINRASPSELILPLSLKKNNSIQNVLLSYPKIAVSYYPDWDFSLDFSYKKLTKQFGVNNLKAFLLDEKSSEVGPAGFLLDYLEKTTKEEVLDADDETTYTYGASLTIPTEKAKNIKD
jgi:DNA mismatch repair protein MutS